MVTLFDEEYIARMYKRDLLSQGEEKGFEKALRNLITATGWTMEQAMISLGLPEPDRPIYREILKLQ